MQKNLIVPAKIWGDFTHFVHRLFGNLKKKPSTGKNQNLIISE